MSWFLLSGIIVDLKVICYHIISFHMFKIYNESISFSGFRVFAVHSKTFWRHCKLVWVFFPMFTVPKTLFFSMFPFGPPKNISKPKVLWCFQGDRKGTLGRKRLTNIRSRFHFFSIFPFGSPGNIRRPKIFWCF